MIQEGDRLMQKHSSSYTTEPIIWFSKQNNLRTNGRIRLFFFLFFSDGYVDDDEEDDAIQKVARKIFKRINWDMWSKK